MSLADNTPLDKQFAILLDFIAEATEPYKSQLTHMLYPLFVHTCMELNQIGPTNEIAQPFFSLNRPMFTDQGFFDILQELSQFLKGQDLEKCPLLSYFRQSKYTVRVSSDCLEYFHLFFKNHFPLSRLINLYIQTQVVEEFDNAHSSSDEAHSPIDIKAEAHSPSSQSQKDSLQALKDSIAQVRDRPPCLPSVVLYTIHPSDHCILNAALSEDSSQMAAGSTDSSIHLYSLASSKLFPSTDTVPQIHLGCNNTDSLLIHSPASHYKVLQGHSGSVNDVKFVPHTNCLLSCSEDTTVRAWSIADQSNVALYQGHTYPVWSLAVSEIGTYFATASKDQTARLWSLDRSYPLRIMVGHTQEVDCVTFHPNCIYMATGSLDKSIRMWTIQEAKSVRMFTGHCGAIYSLAFSPDGKLLASAGEDRVIKLWDIASGNQVKELKGHTDTIHSLCFSENSSLLASGGLDLSLRLWDVRNECSSEEQIISYPTKCPLDLVQFSKHNLLLTVGHSNSEATEEPTDPSTEDSL